LPEQFTSEVIRSSREELMVAGAGTR